MNAQAQEKKGPRCSLPMRSCLFTALSSKSLSSWTENFLPPLLVEVAFGMEMDGPVL